MSEDIDRRIAMEVMGEEEPKVGHHLDSPTWRYVEKADPKSNKVWYEVEPAPFSSSLGESLRALDKYFCGITSKRLTMHYYPDRLSKRFWAFFDNREGWGNTLPEAICNLLLALKEKQ